MQAVLREETLISEVTMCKSLDDLQKFYLERTTTALYDASSAASRSFLLFIVLYAATGLVVFSPVSSAVKIDALGIELPKIYAGEVLLVLACAALYQHFTLLFTEVLLRDKLKEHLANAGGSKTDEWFLRYPSTAHFHGIMAPSISGTTYVIASALNLLLTAGALLFPVIALVQIGRTTHWSASFAAAALVCIFLVISSVLVAARMSKKDPTPDPLMQLANGAASTDNVDRAVSFRIRLIAGILLIVTGALADQLGWGIKPGVGAVQIGVIVSGVIVMASFIPEVFRTIRNWIRAIRNWISRRRNKKHSPPVEPTPPSPAANPSRDPASPASTEL
jgi:hypothetical protein